MKRSKRLGTVVDLAHRKVEEAALALAFVQRKLGEEEHKLGQLEQYLLEYRATIQSEGRKGFSVQEFRRYNDFSENVAKAIAQQTQHVNTVMQQIEQVRRHWQVLDARHKGVLKLRDKALSEENVAQERLEQKELDELAGRWRLRHPRL
jgi:flagellar FliJ protein